MLIYNNIAYGLLKSLRTIISGGRTIERPLLVSWADDRRFHSSQELRGSVLHWNDSGRFKK